MFGRKTRLIECSFLIPIQRDSELSDGSLHSPTEWQWLDMELRARFGGATKSPGLHTGFYTDSDSGQQVADRSRRYVVAVKRKELNGLRDLLQQACVEFHQKCIYLSVAGEVEFLEHP